MMFLIHFMQGDTHYGCLADSNHTGTLHIFFHGQRWASNLWHIPSSVWTNINIAHCFPSNSFPGSCGVYWQLSGRLGQPLDPPWSHQLALFAYHLHRAAVLHAESTQLWFHHSRLSQNSCHSGRWSQRGILAWEQFSWLTIECLKHELRFHSCRLRQLMILPWMRCNQCELDGRSPHAQLLTEHWWWRGD